MAFYVKADAKQLGMETFNELYVVFSFNHRKPVNVVVNSKDATSFASREMAESMAEKLQLKAQVVELSE